MEKVKKKAQSQEVVITGAQKRAQHGKMEKEQFLGWKKMVVQALEERGESTDGSDGKLSGNFKNLFLEEEEEEEEKSSRKEP